MLCATLSAHGRTANGLGKTTGRPTMGTTRRGRPSNTVPNADDQRWTLWRHDCFGYIPAKGAARVHLTYNEFGELATAVGQQLADVGVAARRPSCFDSRQQC